jgi:hypothetical protein
MIIPTNLIADTEIIKGLLDGSLVRYGGVIRQAAGTSQGGQIVRHLTEASGLTSQLMTLPFSPITGTASLVTNTIGHVATFNKLVGIDRQLIGLQQTASSILGFSQIAAGASILNIGVSIAGFAYMGYKLHQTQKAIGNLQKSMAAGFDRLEDRLDALSGQLAYLHLIVEDSREEQQRLGNAIADLHKALLIKNIADLQAELEHLKRFPDDSPKAALKTATSARLFLASQATQAPLEFDANTLMLVDVSTQGWAVAIATEANLLLQHGQIAEAREVLAREIPRFQQHAHQWAKSLLNTERPELATAQRFATLHFKNYIAPERVQRITQISPSDRALSSDQIQQKRRGAKVELEMTRTQPQLTSQWKYRQLAIAEYLDTLSELYARLDGLLAFAQLCEQQEVKSSYELLPDANAKPGLYLLPAVET